MRWIVPCVAMVGFLAAPTGAQESGKKDTTSAMVLNCCGARLPTMFSQFGPPSDVAAYRGKTAEEDDVFCPYDGFGFRVRKKIIRVCFLYKSWTKPIRGIKMGDSRDDVVKAFGKPFFTKKDKEGDITALGFRLKDLDANFYTNFDNEGKVNRVEVSLPD